MGNPASITPRQAPVGTRQPDGYQTLFTFAADPDISIWEVEAQPFGVDIGDKIKTSTMHNQHRHTYAPRRLYDVTDSKMRVAYDPQCLSQIVALKGVETAITQRHPNGDAWADYGFLKSFIPDTNQEGEMPMADCEIVFTGVDPSDGSEQAPVYEADVGTGT